MGEDKIYINKDVLDFIMSSIGVPDLSEKDGESIRLYTLDEAITAAANKAYTDMQLRTVKSSDDENTGKIKFVDRVAGLLENYCKDNGIEYKKVKAEDITKVYKTIFIKEKYIGLIKELLKCNDKESYDNKFNEVCEAITEHYNDILSYGKAQKWVNMTVKYLYVFKMVKYLKDEDLTLFNHNDFLNNLHIPLDSYIYDALSDINIKKSQSPWSNLNSAEYKGCVEDYRDKILDEPPFKWEFGHWLAQKHKAEEKEYKAFKKKYGKYFGEDN